jgi:hypothetical protein
MCEKRIVAVGRVVNGGPVEIVSEIHFLNQCLDELEAGIRQPIVALTDEELASLDDERIGYDESRPCLA